MKLDFPHVSKQSESDAKPIEKTLNTNIRQRSNRLKHIKVNLHLQEFRSHWRKPNENKFHVTGLQTCSSVKINRVVDVVRCLSVALALFTRLLLFSSMFSRHSLSEDFWSLFSAFNFTFMCYSSDLLCSQLKTKRPIQKHDLLTFFMLTDQLFPTTILWCCKSFALEGRAYWRTILHPFGCASVVCVAIWLAVRKYEPNSKALFWNLCDKPTV